MRAALRPYFPAESLRRSPASATPLNRSDLQRVQVLLSRLGFDTGATDGTLGDRTRRAIVDYQKAAGMTADGVPTKPLLEELERVAGGR